MNVHFPRPDAIYDLTPYLDELGLESISALTLQCAYRGYAARQKLKRLRRAKAEKDDVDAAEKGDMNAAQKDDVDAAAEKDAATIEGYVPEQVHSDADGDCSFHPDTHLLTVGENGYQSVTALEQGDEVVSASGEVIVVTYIRSQRAGRIFMLQAGDSEPLFVTGSHRVVVPHHTNDTGTTTKCAEFLDVGDVVICTDGPAHLDVMKEKETNVKVVTITFARDLAVAGPGRAILTKGKTKFRRGPSRKHRGMGFAGDAGVDPPVE
jgi:hypothetical protein